MKWHNTWVLSFQKKRGLKNRIIIIEAYKSSVLKAEMYWGSGKKLNLFFRLERSPSCGIVFHKGIVFLFTLNLLGSGLCLWQNISTVEWCVITMWHYFYRQVQNCILTPLNQLSMSMIGGEALFQPERKWKHCLSSWRRFITTPSDNQKTLETVHCLL